MATQKIYLVTANGVSPIPTLRGDIGDRHRVAVVPTESKAKAYAKERMGDDACIWRLHVTGATPSEALAALWSLYRDGATFVWSSAGHWSLDALNDAARDARKARAMAAG